MESGETSMKVDPTNFQLPGRSRTLSVARRVMRINSWNAYSGYGITIRNQVSTAFPMLEIPENVCRGLPSTYKHFPVVVKARTCPYWLPGVLGGHLGFHLGSCRNNRFFEE